LPAFAATSSAWRRVLFCNPPSLPPEVAAPSGPGATFAYDSLGRTTTSTDFLGRTRMTTYRDAALSVDVRDAEQTSGGHQGSVTTVTRDGHGRVIDTDVHLNVGPQGAAGDLVTSAAYQPTGEPTSIVQTFPGGSVSRSMMYDSLGRLVQNSEPNVGTWTYAHDAEGRVVGTSDSRGCGKNIFYDLAGRILAADYSPCLSAPAQAPYTPPTITPGAFPYPGAEESYAYDTSGRLSNVSDRARLDSYAYQGGIPRRNRQATGPSRSAGSAPELRRDTFGVLSSIRRVGSRDPVAAGEPGCW